MKHIPFFHHRGLHAKCKLLRRIAGILTVLLSLSLCGCRFNPFPEGYFQTERDTVSSIFSSPESVLPGAEANGVSSEGSIGTVWLTLGDRNIPPFDGENAAYVLYDNEPLFTDGELYPEAFEQYSSFDSLGRTGTASACINKDMMPDKERGTVQYPAPSGYINRRYVFIDNGGYVYNHCHLIGYQLTGQTDNALNLITGTRYLNVEGMLPYENLVANYLEKTGNHVLYRITPLYVGEELVARGVEMEARSIEDGGKGIRFHVFCYNVQPGVIIDYQTGENRADGTM